MNTYPETTPIILASASPRRRRLLQNAGFSLLEIVPADVDETPIPGESVGRTALRLARRKAEAVAPRFPEAIVLGADTLVELDGRRLGKPTDTEHARRMLAQLSGRVHRVLTGVCLLRLRPFRREAWTTATDVHFRKLTPALIDKYLCRVHAVDKAGGYAIQEFGDILVERVDGWISNVVGLPIEELHRRLDPFRPRRWPMNYSG